MLQLLSAASLAKKYVLPLAIAGLVAALGVQSLRVTNATSRLAVERAEHAATRTLLEAQSAGVQAVADKAAAVKAASQRAVAKAEGVALAAEKRARALETASTPVSCEAAIEFLVRDAGGVE